MTSLHKSTEAHRMQRFTISCSDTAVEFQHKLTFSNLIMAICIPSAKSITNSSFKLVDIFIVNLGVEFTILSHFAMILRYAP